MRMIGKLPTEIVALLLLTSCSDGALPRSQGVASLHFEKSLSGTATTICPLLDHQMNSPISPLGMPLVTGSASFDDAVDGQATNYVKCRVAPELDKYRVTGEVITTGLGADGSEVTTDVSVQVLIGENDTQLEGTLHASDDKTGIAPYVSDACLFTVLPSADAPALGIGPGHVWAQVSCAQIDDMRNFRGDECAIQGFIKFDACGQ